MTPADLEHLVRAHGRRWRLIAAQWTDAPDDCIQEALLRLIRQHPAPDNPFTWVLRVVRNLAISQSRRSQVSNAYLSELTYRADVWTNPDPARRLDWQDAVQALEDLDPSQRLVVVSKIWGEMTYQEIGELLDCSTATAHRTFQQAMQVLRQRLESDPQSTHTADPTRSP